MTAPPGMETHTSRLASFAAAHPVTKKRTSSAKNAKALKWPHATPTPEQLAQAGFYYQPTSASPDNVRCYVCHKDLDGWEVDDDPTKEHLSFSPDCGWAVQASLEQETENGGHGQEHPLSERMIEARKATFCDMWPHEKKRGWTCKVQKMVDAGWYYCPTAESDDFVRCAYCNLSLDGWEPKDKPFDEHQRRSPNCAFFMVEQPTKPKATKGRKGRVSKASRMSTQSNVTITTEDQPMLDATIDEGTSALSTATDATMASNTSKARKAGRPKKAKAKGRGKALKSKEEEPQISSFMEPEDDNFEVKVPAPPSRTTRGKKRTSEEMETNSVLQDEIQPPTKRRATRTRSGTVKPQTEPGSLDHEKDTTDVQMADAEEVPPAPVSKKGGKGAKKRGSSSVRKASNLSTASKASLRAAIPADEEIEAALEADLDRPLTDDEAQEPIDEQKPQTCRLTRTKQSSRKGPALASIASVRMAARASAESQKELSLHAMDHVATKEKEPSVLDDTQDQRPTKSANGRKVKKDSTAEPAYETATELQNQSIDYELSNAMDVDDMVNHETTHALPRVQVVVEVQSTARESSGTIGTVQAVKEQIAKPKGTKGRPKGKKNSKIEQESQVDDESPVEANVQSPHAPTTQSEPLPIDNSPQVQAQPPPTPQNQIPSPTPSPQSSDAENHPPSSRPSQTRPPPPQLSPLQSRTTRVPLAASTPNTSPSKRNVARLETTYPWSAVDLDYIFLNSPNVDKENADLADLKNVLTSPEKKMTVEEWIKYNARNAEEKLKAECERTVGKFESEGVRALKALEGIVCLE